MSRKTVHDIAYAILGAFLLLCFSVIILAGFVSITDVLLRWLTH